MGKPKVVMAHNKKSASNDAVKLKTLLCSCCAKEFVLSVSKIVCASADCVNESPLKASVEPSYFRLL